MTNVAALEAKLNSFTAAERTGALETLAGLAEQGAIQLPPLVDAANMHSHTFFSFNGYGHSPTSLAWLARRHGFKLMGIVDFDVLDGVDEFLEACELVGIRGSAGIETRLYIPEFAAREINSPGEPGVYYHMGVGFTASDPPQPAATILADMRRRAVKRNKALVARINAHLDPATIDYDQDVLPLTPAGNPTERHIVAAYLQAVRQTGLDPVPFWADKLGLPPAQVAAMLDDQPQFQNLVRKKLMKQGGVGYVRPGPETFPPVEAFHDLIVACGALPCATWLDGLSAGEQAMGELLELLTGQGVAALNIIPDRNWNIADPALKQRKLQNLYDVVALAQSLDLPLNIGTEMNSYGQKLIDDFDAPELAPVRDAFMDGAFFIYGHTVAQRKLGRGYQSDWAKSNLPIRRERNAFYTNLGRQIEPGQASQTKLRQIMVSVSKFSPRFEPGRRT